MAVPVRASLALYMSLFGAVSIFAQTPAATDELIFINGEKLIGELKSATDTKVTFKSNMAGEVTVEWSKVQELRTAKHFATIHKDVVFQHRSEAAKVPRGNLEMKNQTIEIAGAERPIPVGQVSNVVSEVEFERALHHRSWREGWLGSATAGLAFTRSTQDLNTVTSTIELARNEPGETWLRPRARTYFDFTSAYGKITQPGSPAIKTSLYHSDAERDFYFSNRFYALAGGTWDHNSAQGLDLQQAYGGGFGFTIFKNEHTDFQVMGTLRYIKQQFTDSASNKNLIASRFNQTFSHTFANKMTFSEQAGITPAYNNTDAYSAGYIAAFTIPVYHRVGFSITSFDQYINDPPPGFKKNSFQLTVGATYAFK